MAKNKKVGGVSIEMVLDMKKLKKGVVEFKSGFSDINSSLSKAEKKLIQTRIEANKAGNEFKKAGEKAKKSGDQFKSSFSGITSAIRTSTATVLGFGAAYVGSLGAMVGVTDKYISLQNQLRQRTDGSAESVQKLSDEIFEMANRNRVPVDAMSSAYQRFDSAIVGAGGNSKETKIVLDSTTKSLALMGAGAAETSSVMIQLSQAFGSGVLRGDEFNSINEAAPNIMKAIAKEMGVTQGALRSYAEEGKITADIVKAALINSNDEITRSFNESRQTVGQSITILKNDLTKAFGELDEKIGANTKIQLFIETIRKNIPNMISAIEKAIDVMAFFAGVIGKVVDAGKALYNLFTGTLIGKGILALAAAFGTAVVATYTLTKAFGVLKATTLIVSSLFKLEMVKSLAAYVIGTNSAAVATGVFSKAMRIAAIAARGLLIATGVGAVLVGLGLAVEGIIGKLDEFKPKSKGAKDALSELGDKFSSEVDKINKALEDSNSLDFGVIFGGFEDSEKVQEAREKIVSELKKIGKEVGIAEKDIRARLQQYNDAYPETLSAEGFNNFVEEVAGKIDELDKVLEKGVLRSEEIINKMNVTQENISFEEMVAKIKDANVVIDSQYQQLFERMSEKALEAGRIAESVNFAIASGMSTQEGLQMIRDAGANVTTEQYNSLVPEMRNAIQASNEESQKIIDGAVAIDSSKGAFKAAGNNVIANLNNGLESQKSKLVQTLQNLARPINDFIKKISGIDIGKLFSRFSTAAKAVGDNPLVAKITAGIKSAQAQQAKQNLITISGAGSDLAKEESLSIGGGGGSSRSGGSSKKINNEEKKLQKERENRLKKLERETIEAEKNIAKTQKKFNDQKKEAEKKDKEEKEKTGDEIEKLSKKHKDFKNSVKADLRDLQDDIKSLTDEYNELKKELEKDFKADVSERFLEAQKELEELQKKEEELKSVINENTSGELTEEKSKAIQEINSLKKEQIELEKEISLAQKSAGAEQIKEAERLDNLSQTERLIEEYNQKQKKEKETFDLEKAVLKEKEAIQQAYLDGELEKITEVKNYENQLYLEELQEEQKRYENKTTALNNHLDDIAKKHKDHLDNYLIKEKTATETAISYWERLKAAKESAQSGGSDPTAQAIPAFANGTRYVQGAGTGTSDSILARLSKGERVITATNNRIHAPLYDAIENLSSVSSVNNVSENNKIVNNYNNNFNNSPNLSAKQLVQMQRFYN